MARLIENRIQFPYKRSLGPVFGAFMTALVGRKILGIRNGDKVLAPPLEWDPATGEELAPDFVEVGPAGTVKNWTWVPEPTEQHPLDRPFAFAIIQLDGADNSMIHAVDAGSIDAMSEGMRVAPRWRAERIGKINDIVCFVPGEEPDVPEGDAGEAPEEPVTIDGVLRVHHVPEPGPGQRRARRRSRQGEAPARAAVPGVRADLRRRSRLLPHRLGGAHRGARRRPARSVASSATTRSSRRCSTRARPRPSRSPG